MSSPEERVLVQRDFEELSFTEETNLCGMTPSFSVGPSVSRMGLGSWQSASVSRHTHLHEDAPR